VRVGYEEVLLTVLTPWGDNPRFNADAVPMLADLIRKHGFAGVIVATPDGVIRAGHTRYAALKHLGWEKVWVHWKDFDSEEEAENFALADNKAGEWASWDHAKLAKLFRSRVMVEMKELEASTGFRQQEIQWAGVRAVDPRDVKDPENETGSEDFKFVLRIDDITDADKKKILRKVQKALEGTGYVAGVF